MEDLLGNLITISLGQQVLNCAALCKDISHLQHELASALSANASFLPRLGQLRKNLAENRREAGFSRGPCAGNAPKRW
jgi:hypothetical protein